MNVWIVLDNHCRDVFGVYHSQEQAKQACKEYFPILDHFVQDQDFVYGVNVRGDVLLIIELHQIK